MDEIFVETPKPPNPQGEYMKNITELGATFRAYIRRAECTYIFSFSKNFLKFQMKSFKK